MPRARSVVVLLVLVATASSGCTSRTPAEPATTEASATPATSTVEQPPSGAGTGGNGVADPVGLNALEQRVISALESVGVESPGIAEHGFRSAAVWGGWMGGTALVNAFEQPAARMPGKVTGTVDLEGISGEVVTTGPFGDLIRFRCDDIEVEVAHLRGDGEAGSGDATRGEALARLLVPPLGC